MRTKTQVNEAISLGVLAAHTVKYLSVTCGAPSNVEELHDICKLMAEALITIDLGYSCSSEELEAGVTALASEHNTPKEVVSAFKVRAHLKEIERMSPAEQAAKLKEMVAERFTSILVLKP